MEFLTRIRSKLQREVSRWRCRRPWTMQNREALISFTFDDFPASAFHVAGAILAEHGISGTYYTSLGLMGTTAPTGKIFNMKDLAAVLECGHELGCHTFGHCDAARTPASVFEASVLENRGALQTLIPDADGFQTLSYPIGSPLPGTKKRCAPYFVGCRGGGQMYNTGGIDLNLLNAFFIEQSRDHPRAIKSMIDATCAVNGWLIFATHDVCQNPTRYGCNPALFKEIVQYAVASGARLLPICAALKAIGAVSSETEL